LKILQKEITILPKKSDSDAAATQNYGCHSRDDERGVGFPGFFWGGGDRRCFHVFLQIMTD
jgi:hypothetical protein